MSSWGTCDPAAPTSALITTSEEARDCLAAVDAQAEHLEINSSGVCIKLRRFGSGPPLVLLHGGHGSWMHWVRNVDELAKSHSVWIPDMPGYGDSDSPIGSDLNAVLEPILVSLTAAIGKSEEISLIGFSFGGLVSAHLASSCPQVRRLALVGAAGHGTRRRPRGELLSWKAFAEKNQRDDLLQVMRHNLGLHMFSESTTVDPLALELHTRSCLRTRFRSRPLSRSGDLKKTLEKYDGALLSLWGEDDVTATPSDAVMSLYEAYPKSKNIVVTGSGHWLPYEKAEIFNSLVIRWLNGSSQGDLQ